MTERECEVLFDLFRVRLAGKGGGAVCDKHLEAANLLTEKGWLTSRPYGDDTVFELSDVGFTSLRLAGLNRNHPADQN